MAVWFEEFGYIDGKIIPFNQSWIMDIFILLFHKMLFFYRHYELNWRCENSVPISSKVLALYFYFEEQTF